MITDADGAVTGSIRYAPLSGEHLEAIFSLHLEATRAVGRPDLVKPESREFFRRMLAGEGRVIGAMNGSALVGYGVLQFDLPPSEDARSLLGLDASDTLAKLAGASVVPSAWGAGTHDRLIRLRIAAARAARIENLYSTSAPGNGRSWTNLLDAGFAICALVEKYGGHLRYVLHRGAHERSSTAGGVWCDAADIERQRSLLGAGSRGVAWRRRADGGLDLRYQEPS